MFSKWIIVGLQTLIQHAKCVYDVAVTEMQGKINYVSFSVNVFVDMFVIFEPELHSHAISIHDLARGLRIKMT
jgi:hypothetical protein